MRRMLALALAVLLVLPAAASAQTVIPILGPGGVLAYSNASMTAVNTIADITLFSYQIPAGLIATGTTAGATVPILGTTMTAGALMATPVPLHLRMIGDITTNQGVSGPGTFNLGIGLGASTATITLASAVAPLPNLVQRAAQIDVWISPIATTTATPNTPNSGNTVYLSARLRFDNTQSNGGTVANVASETIINGNVIGTISTQTAPTFTVIWKWSSASQTNNVTFRNRIFKVGD